MVTAAWCCRPVNTLVQMRSGHERRYLTVMFCDLVGSTGISAQLDAEGSILADSTIFRWRRIR